eukprot:scaffold24806_cov129-Isochrysis_galbana.AAC.7
MWIVLVPPHDNPSPLPTLIPSPLAGEGIQFPNPRHERKKAHFPGTQERETGWKVHGRGKRKRHLVLRGRRISARGPSHTPFGGVRQLANTYRQCGANR